MPAHGRIQISFSTDFFKDYLEHYEPGFLIFAGGLTSDNN
jgi:hypothetical protein